MCASTTRCARAGLWTTPPRRRPSVGAAPQPCSMDTFTTRPFLLASGLSSDEVRRALRDGDLTPVRRGAYLTGPPPEFADARHLLLLRAAREHLVPEAVASHVSAA